MTLFESALTFYVIGAVIALILGLIEMFSHGNADDVRSEAPAGIVTIIILSWVYVLIWIDRYIEYRKKN